MHNTYIPNQNFYSIRISVLHDETKIEEKKLTILIYKGRAWSFQGSAGNSNTPPGVLFIYRLKL